MPALDGDKDVQFLEELIKNSIVQKTFPTSLQNVFDEELGAFLRGTIDGKALSDHLRSRVGLYLEEAR